MKDVLAIGLLTLAAATAAVALAWAFYTSPGAMGTVAGVFSGCALFIIGIPWAVVRLQDRPRKNRRLGGRL
jgi:hypothetical protein